MYHAAKRWRDERRIRREQAKLRRNQPIIRQGSPECFEGLPLKVDFQVTSFCNYRCSYCFDAKKGYERAFCTLDQAETAIRHLVLANRPSYLVTLIGGEPTSHPHLAEIVLLLCRNLGDRLQELMIVTNGTFKEQQIDEILKITESECRLLKLVVSIHLEYAKIDKVADLAKRLSGRCCLEFRLMYHPDMTVKAADMANTLCALRKMYPFGMEVTKLRIPPSFDEYDSRYTQEHFDQIKEIKERFEEAETTGPEWQNTLQFYRVERKNGKRIKRYERVSPSQLESLTQYVFTGMICCSGTHVLRINTDGGVKGKLCELVREGINIFKENPFEREDWMKAVSCKCIKCGCCENWRIPKFNSHVEAERFIEQLRLEQKKLMTENQEA